MTKDTADHIPEIDLSKSAFRGVRSNCIKASLVESERRRLLRDEADLQAAVELKLAWFKKMQLEVAQSQGMKQGMFATLGDSCTRVIQTLKTFVKRSGQFPPVSFELKYYELKRL